MERIRPSNDLVGWVLAAAAPVVYLIAWPVVLIPWLLFAFWFMYRKFGAVQCVNPAGRAVYITGGDEVEGGCERSSISQRRGVFQVAILGSATPWPWIWTQLGSSSSPGVCTRMAKVPGS
jgi:hypothetical protein